MSGFDADQALARIERLQHLTDALARARGDFAEQQDLFDRIRRELALARESLALVSKNRVPL
jgi:hypothetical protein